MTPWFTPKKKKDDADVQADDKIIARNMCVKLQVKEQSTSGIVENSAF